MAVYMGFLIAYGTALPSVSMADCTGDPGTTFGIFSNFGHCAAAVFAFFGLLFDILTLGGIGSPLPALIQGPLVLFFAITWGVIIVKGITNTIGAIVP